MIFLAALGLSLFGLTLLGVNLFVSAIVAFTLAVITGWCEIGIYNLLSTTIPRAKVDERVGEWLERPLPDYSPTPFDKLMVGLKRDYLTTNMTPEEFEAHADRLRETPPEQLRQLQHYTEAQLNTLELTQRKLINAYRIPREYYGKSKRKIDKWNDYGC